LQKIFSERSVRRIFAVGLGSLAILTNCDIALGQTPLPGPADPGRITPPLDQLPLPPPRPETDVVPVRRPNAAPDNADQIRFVLRGLAITGVTVYADDAFRSIIEPKIGQEISLGDLYRIADAITARYGDDGYILSQALVPAQRIESGIARIEVVEGVIDRIIFDGDVPANTKLMQRIADHIRATQPLTAKALERYLLLLGDLPGYDVRSVLSPSETEGATDLMIQIDHKPMQGVAVLDNRGTRYMGPIQFQLGTKFNNALGYNEGIGATVVTTGQPNELKSFGLSYETPVTSDGTNLNAAVSKSFVSPGYTLKPLNIDSEVTSVAFGLSHSLIRSRSTNFTVRADLDSKDVKTRSNGGQAVLSDDHLRAIRLGGRYELLDNLVTPAFSSFNGRVSHGVGVLGASDKGNPLASRPQGNPDYSKVNVETQRLQTLWDDFNLLLAGAGQYSFSKLLSPEEFGFGGEEFGRGFNASEFAGEHGLAGKMELQYGGEGGMLPVDKWQLYGFYDAGAIWNKDPAEGESARHILASMGGGVRLTFSPSVSGYIEVAKPVIDRVHSVGEENGKDLRFFFGIVAKY
jgi:hemolysin activation/secretion protein